MKGSEKNEVRNEGEAGVRICEYSTFVCMHLHKFPNIPTEFHIPHLNKK